MIGQGIGDLQVRIRGTIGGWISNADPAAGYRAHLVTVMARRAVAAAG